MKGTILDIAIVLTFIGIILAGVAFAFFDFDSLFADDPTDVQLPMNITCVPGAVPQPDGTCIMEDF